MNLDSLLPNLGEWLRGTGPESDVVVSTRIRLARNLAGIPFTTRANNHQKAEIEQRVREAVAKSDIAPRLEYLSVMGLMPLDRLFLVERQLISRELAGGLDGPRGVAFDPTETASVMVNEEDHLRLQVLRSGFALDEAWHDIDLLDDALEHRLSYAFHTQFGYLTACPTNVGTGMRASVMLHLPALGLTKQIDKVFEFGAGGGVAAQHIGKPGTGVGFAPQAHAAARRRAWTSNTAKAAGVIPPMRPAAPSVAGIVAARRSAISRESPGTAA